MSARRGWLGSGGLLLVAGAVTVVSAPRAQRGNGVDPTTAGLTALAAALLVVAWLLVAGWARGSAARLALAAVVVAQPALVFGFGALQLALPERLNGVGVSGWLTWPAEIVVFPLLLGAGWVLEESLAVMVRLMLLGWGVTSFGAVHQALDHMASTALLLDAPYGGGLLTGCTQLLTGVAVLVISLLHDRPGDPETGPTEDDEEGWGTAGYALAA